MATCSATLTDLVLTEAALMVRPLMSTTAATKLFGPERDASTKSAFSLLLFKFLKDTLLSSPGYTTKNLVHVQSAAPGEQPGEHPEVDFYLTCAFVDCYRCRVMRHHYIDGGAGCTLWKPESKINERDECCEFIFDLLCGTLPKYHISDNCFQSS
ncbi:hypothetical protein MTO96_029975 [Rhipicephalus appendiculatus]